MKKLLLSFSLTISCSLIMSMETEIVIPTISHIHQENLNKELLKAVYAENTELIQRLLYDGANVNEQNDLGYTLLHYLPGGEDKDDIIANLLIKAGAQLNIQDQWGNSPLHELIFCEGNYDHEDEPELINVYKNLINLYIESGADLKLRNRDLETPLLRAMVHRSYIAAKILLTSSQDVDVNAKDDGELTALHMAAIDNTLDITKLLIENGAHIDHCDNYNHITPLHSAVCENSFEVAELLIKSGANTTIQDKLGFTASNYCKTKKIQSLFLK